MTTMRTSSVNAPCEKSTLQIASSPRRAGTCSVAHVELALHAGVIPLTRQSPVCYRVSRIGRRIWSEAVSVCAGNPS